MRALLALAFIGAVAASTTLTDAVQEYRIFYSAPGCNAADAIYIGQVDSYDWVCTPTACSVQNSGSIENVCLNGMPKNLGVRIWNLYGTCGTGTTMPLVDYYLPTLVGNERVVTDIETWKVGCQLEYYYSSTYYNFIAAPAAGGATVYEGGNCGSTNNACTAADCTGLDYSLPSGTSGCDTIYTDVYMETTQTFPTSATAAGYFEIDYSVYVFADKSPTSCCKLTGDCNCCVADGDACCNPSSLGFTDNVCCDDNSAVDNNTLAIQLFQACLCDQNGEERGTYDAATSTCTPNDVSSTSFTSNATLTQDLADTFCDYLNIFAWCNAHAYQDEQYFEDTENTDAWDANQDTYTAEDYYYIGGSTTEALDCFTFSGDFQPSVLGTYGYDAGLVNTCQGLVDGITGLGLECEVDCGSGSTLAFAAILAFF